LSVSISYPMISYHTAPQYDKKCVKFTRGLEVS